MKNKERFLLSLSLVILLLALKPFTVGAASSNTWAVHPTDPRANFTKIQDAVNNAINGDYIEVWNSSYTENIYVNKSLTIYSRDGKDVTIVQANNSDDHVFEVTADWVNISGFTVKNANEFGMAGIYLNGVEHCDISNSSVTNNDIGIALIGSFENTIRDNLAETNIEYGIYMELSNDNLVSNNTVRFTEFMSGISLFDSSDNKITNNIAKSNLWGVCGIELVGISCNNTIDNNTASSNGGAGIIFWIWTGNDVYDNNTITNNTASYNSGAGIELQQGSHTNIKNNVANSNGGPGIALCFWTNNNTLENNTVSYNEYSGIELVYNTSNNSIKNNTARHNNVSGIALYHSSSDNTVSHNKLYSNQFGLSIVSLGGTPSNNQLMNNTISFSKSHGIYLLDLKYANNVTNNTVSNSNLYGILIENSTNSSISSNIADFNERGIGLVESSVIEVINNTANSNIISGISLINSSASTMHDNIARFNVYEGIYLSNSSLNTISHNDVSGTQNSASYFGISLYSSNNNDIVNNNAGWNYYFGVFNYSSFGNMSNNSGTVYNQTDEIRGVRVYVPEVLTPSLQSVMPSTNATYDIVVENLGNMPDTFDLNISSSNDHYAVSLDKNTVSLGPGAISVNTTLYEIPPRVTMNVETIKLNVRGDEPGVCRVKVEANSSDTTVKDSVETWTIVQGENGSVAKINSTIMDSALIDSSIIDSTVTNSAINNSIISASTITDSIIKNSTVIGTSLKDVIVEDAMVTDGNISRGNITIYSSPGIPFVIHKEIPISELVVGADHFDSNLVGLTYLRSLKSLTVDGANSDTGFDVNAKDDYSAGSLSVQRSIIPPFGFEECPNTVEGYVAVEVSDNVAQSTDVVAIKVFYDPAKVVELNFNESSLTLLRYNESADQDPWEPVPDQWLNLEAHYVEGNLSRYSVFALVGQPPALEPLGPGLAVVTGGGRVPNPWEIAILIASPGINFFHFEWLGLDILSVATDLKNVAMNAKVGLKRTDKPVEIPDCPGSVYGYYDISTNLESANLDSVTINFRVSKVWTVFNDLSVESVKLYRYTTSWEELKTSKFTEDNDYIYFSAESPDLSLFAIAGKKKAAEIEPPTRPTIPTPTPSAPAPSPLATPHASPGPSPFPVVPMVVVIAILVVVLIVAVIYMVRRRS